MNIIDRLRRRRRLEGMAMLLLSFALGGVVLALMIPAGYIHLKFVIASGVLLLIGLWRLLREPWWIRCPDQVERLDHSGRGTQIIMRGGRLYDVSVTPAERDELEKEIQQRANEIRLRARVVS